MGEQPDPSDRDEQDQAARDIGAWLAEVSDGLDDDETATFDVTGESTTDEGQAAEGTGRRWLARPGRG